MAVQMRPTTDDRLEKARVHTGSMASTAADGMMGAFMIIGPLGTELVVISSGVDFEYAWEHVSVSTLRRTPNWTEMCFVKNLFWDEDETVMQLHPSKDVYVNHHPYCLHLWRPLKATIPMPPSVLVGPIG